jgi:hypothetical protein
MGYRFALRRAAWQQQVRPRQTLGLSTWWVNEGVAPVYRPYVLAFRFTSPEHSAIVRTTADIRKWLPGDTVFDGPLFVPEDLAPGDYRLSVALLDTDTLKPAIRLAIEGRDPDGWYGLGTVHVTQSH